MALPLRGPHTTGKTVKFLLSLHLFLMLETETGLNIKKSCSYSHLSIPLMLHRSSNLESSEVPRIWCGGRTVYRVMVEKRMILGEP